jgi:hypothetical protein
MSLVDKKTIRFVFQGIAAECKPILVSPLEAIANPRTDEQETIAIGKLIALYVRKDKSLLMWLVAMAAEDCNLHKESAELLVVLKVLPEQPNFDVLVSKPAPSEEYSGTLPALEAIDNLVDEDLELSIKVGATPSGSLGEDRAQRLAGLISTYAEWSFDEVSLIFSESFYFCGDPQSGERIFELGFEDAA